MAFINHLDSTQVFAVEKNIMKYMITSFKDINKMGIVLYQRNSVVALPLAQYSRKNAIESIDRLDLVPNEDSSTGIQNGLLIAYNEFLSQKACNHSRRVVVFTNTAPKEEDVDMAKQLLDQDLEIIVIAAGRVTKDMFLGLVKREDDIITLTGITSFNSQIGYAVSEKWDKGQIFLIKILYFQLN